MSPSTPPPWHARLTAHGIPPLMAVAICMGAMVLFWLPGVTHMIGVWAISPTYTHGFLVAPGVIGLIAMGWRKAEALRIWPQALVGVPIATIMYVLGDANDVMIIRHTAIVVGAMSICAGLFGARFATRHRFALGFLLFLVPVGEGLVPMLQIITAKGIMVATSLFGVMAFRDGTMIMTDAGNFLVEEGCAGLRFLIASIVTGILGAHLFFSTPLKQAAFIIAAIIVPIFANIIRASAVVLIGSWTEMKVATGFDHLLYGWGFFAIIMATLVGIGTLLAEDNAPIRPDPPLGNQQPIPLIACISVTLCLSAPIWI